MTPRPHTTRRGFSLVELLVTIGIIALLLGLLLPAALKALGAGERARLAADHQAIRAALDAYEADFGDIPRPDATSDEDNTGFAVLAKALVGPGPEIVTDFSGNIADADYLASSRMPADYDAAKSYRAGDIVANAAGPHFIAVRQTVQGDPPNTGDGYWEGYLPDDGADGPGMRASLDADPATGVVRATGPISPPYLAPDRFDVQGMALRDALGEPILYFTGNPRPSSPDYVGAFADDNNAALNESSSNNFARYDLSQNATFFLAPGESLSSAKGVAIDRMQASLGDYDLNGGISTNAAVAEPSPRDDAFLLWSSGPDLVFGLVDVSNDPATNRARVEGLPAPDGTSVPPLDDVISVKR